MFAYLLESERKAYNPLSFCKTYTMDHQPLNTGEQKDMAEFFIDLLSKTEEMTPELKDVVKTTFCGTLSNNVVSLDCEHVSTTTEEFYTVRCQVFERFFVLFFLDVPIFFKVVFYILIVSLKVAEMRSLYQSLEEVCVKDMLKGDNKYTCSQCGTKVFILFSSNSIFSRFQASFVHDSFLRCERKREPASSRCRTYWLSTRCVTASTWSP